MHPFEGFTGEHILDRLPRQDLFMVIKDSLIYSSSVGSKLLEQLLLLTFSALLANPRELYFD